MWRDLDRATGRLSVMRSLEQTKKGMLLKTPKTARSTRVIPLPPVALNGLYQRELEQKEHRLAAGPALQDQGLIFPDATGNPQRPRNVTKAFAVLVTRAKLGRISIHGLRHTHVTELLRAGVHPKVVYETLGTLRWHSHFSATLMPFLICSKTPLTRCRGLWETSSATNRMRCSVPDFCFSKIV